MKGKRRDSLGRISQSYELLEDTNGMPIVPSYVFLDIWY